jgi:hypothetical protein
VRKYSIHAGLRSRRIEDELRLPVLLQDGVIVVDHDRSIRISVRRNADTKNGEICSECQKGRPQQNQQRGEEDPPEPIPEIPSRGLGHEARLYSWRHSRALGRRGRLSPHRPSRQTGALLPSASPSLTTRPPDRQTTAFAGNRFWRASEDGVREFRPSRSYTRSSLRPWP